MEKIKCLHLVWGWGVGKKEKIFLIQKSFFLKTFLFIEFSDANAKFYCRLYYAGEFHKMREVILGSSEEDFIRSLSHSSPWQARGGKSGAAFYATEGRRFCFCLVAQLCPTVCNPMDCSLPGSSVHARILEERISPGKNSGVGCHFLLQGLFDHLPIKRHPSFFPQVIYESLELR